MQALSAGRGLTGEAPPGEPSRDFELHAVSLPARAFTGDFYFTAKTPGSTLAVIGDVAGKGLSSAILMGMIQEELDRLVCLEGEEEPLAILQRLQDAIRAEMPSNRFATMVAARLDANGDVTIANAGHCPPLLIRAGGVVEQIPSGGPPVGIAVGPTWRRSSLRWRPGDALVLYTDGLIEARSAQEEEFGMERLRELVRAFSGSEPKRLSRAILSAVRAHAGGEPQDDFTLLIARFGRSDSRYRTSASAALVASSSAPGPTG